LVTSDTAFADEPRLRDEYKVERSTAARLGAPARPRIAWRTGADAERG
jgi:hypothetical protein